MTARERVKQLVQIFPEIYPGAHCELNFKNPLELLIATILSAQCTDKRVNMVTPTLFKKYRRAADYAKTPAAELESAIKSTGFFRNKTKSIRAATSTIAEKFNGRVPDTMEELLQLPGVGRKTANVILGNAFGKDEGFVVDTHVARLAWRMGLTRQTDPVKIEQDLIELVPKGQRTIAAHRLIFHGRRICQARKPRCSECPVNDLCPKVGVRLAAEG